MSAQNKLDNATQRYLHRMLFKVDITCKALASFKTYLWYVSLGQKLSELRLATIASQKCWNRGNISIHVLERSLLYELLMESWNMACLDLHDASWWHVLIWLVTHFFGYEGRGGVEGECSTSLMNVHNGGYVMSHPINLLIKGIYLNLLHSRRVSGFSTLASHSASEVERNGNNSKQQN